MVDENFRKLQYAFAAHLREPEAHPAPADVEDRRMKIYRELFFNNIQSLLAGTFPVIRRTLPATRWQQLVRGFYHFHVSHTPLFMEIPQEFLEWLSSAPAGNSDLPPFLQELAHYEWVELAVSIDTHEIDELDCDPDGNILDGVPVISPVAWPLAYRFPVHRIGPDFQPVEPGEQPTFLVVYRGRNDEVGFMELNAVTARLLELAAGEHAATGRELLERIAGEIGHPDPAAVVAGGQQLLEQLKQQDIVLGTRR